MDKVKRNGYHLQNQFEAWKIHNQGKYKATHVALFTSLISLNNKLKWVENFGVPRDVTKMQSGISNGASYTKAFDDLEEFGLIKVIQKSKNQYTATVITLVTDLDVSYKEIDGIIMDVNAEVLNTKTNKQTECHIQKPSGTVSSTVLGTVSGTVPIYKQPNNKTTKQLKVFSDTFYSFWESNPPNPPSKNEACYSSRDVQKNVGEMYTMIAKLKSKRMDKDEKAIDVYDMSVLLENANRHKLFKRVMDGVRSAFTSRTNRFGKDLREHIANCISEEFANFDKKPY